MSYKKQWIINYIYNSPFKSVDILEETFVDAYIKEFNPKCEPTMLGAFRCKELSKQLSKMHKEGMLKRTPLGLRGGAWQDGFPKWVYRYYT